MAIPYASARRSANLASKVYTLHSLPYPLALLWSRKLDETSVKGRLLKTLLGFPQNNLQSDYYEDFFTLVYFPLGYGARVDTISTEDDDNNRSRARAFFARRGKDEMLQKNQDSMKANIGQAIYNLTGYRFRLFRLG